MPPATTTAIATKTVTGSVYVPSVPRFLRFLGNLAPQCIAGHEHERAIKPAIDLGREHRFGLAGPSRQHTAESGTLCCLCDDKSSN